MLATNVLPSPVFISAMSPSWRTMPPIIWTSKMRWSDSRTRASRTAANASKSTSSSVSPFSSRCRNSAVFPRSSSSERLWNSGSSVAMYAACSAMRFMRRPSPKRRAFRAMEGRATSGTGYRLASPRDRGPEGRTESPRRSEGRGLDLPEVGVEAACPHDVFGPLALADPLQRRRAAECGTPVDVQCPALAGDHELRLVPRSPSTWTTVIREAATAQVVGPRRTDSARYGGGTVPSTASASGASASSGSSSSTRSVPSPSATKFTASPRSPGASAVTTASQRRGRGTPWIPGSPRGSPSQPGGSATCPSRGGGAPPSRSMSPASASRTCSGLRRPKRATLRCVAVVRGVAAWLDAPPLAIALHLPFELVDELVDRGSMSADASRARSVGPFVKIVPSAT